VDYLKRLFIPASFAAILLVLTATPFLIAGEEQRSAARGEGIAGSSDTLNSNSQGVLDQIVLTISPDQVVGLSLLSAAQLILLDETSVLLTDYDLAANPIQLVPDKGSLIPDTLDDTTLFNEGVIDFLPAQVRYEGRTGLGRDSGCFRSHLVHSRHCDFQWLRHARCL